MREALAREHGVERRRLEDRAHAQRAPGGQRTGRVEDAPERLDAGAQVLADVTLDESIRRQAGQRVGDRRCAAAPIRVRRFGGVPAAGSAPGRARR